MKNMRIVQLIGVLVVGVFVGRGYDLLQQQSCSKLSLRLEALTKARELHTTVTALSLLKKEKISEARVFLETHMRSSLVVLRTLKPTLDLSSDDMKKVSESIEMGESYVAAGSSQ